MTYDKHDVRTDLIRVAITEWFGERCPDFDEDCRCCRVWAQFDALSEPVPTAPQVPQVAWPEWFETHNGGRGVTDAQKAMLFRKWQQADQGMSWPAFVQTACPWDFGAIGVQWCGMFIGIETDGYPHS